MQKTLLLVDGSSYLYRAFHALPDLRSAEGLTTMLYVDPRTAALQPGGKLEQGKTYTVIARAAGLSWNPKDTQSLDVLSYSVTE